MKNILFKCLSVLLIFYFLLVKNAFAFEFGKIVDKKINELIIYKDIGIDIYCIMPNHIHLILIVGAGPRVRPLIKKINTSYMDLDLGSTQGSTGQPIEIICRMI